MTVKRATFCELWSHDAQIFWTISWYIRSTAIATIRRTWMKHFSFHTWLCASFCWKMPFLRGYMASSWRRAHSSWMHRFTTNWFSPALIWNFPKVLGIFSLVGHNPNSIQFALTARQHFTRNALNSKPVCHYHYWLRQFYLSIPFHLRVQVTAPLGLTTLWKSANFSSTSYHYHPLLTVPYYL